MGHGITFRSGSPRPLSKPRNTFTLYTTPLSRAVRPICSVRRLARRTSAGIDLSDIRTRWETHTNDKSIDDIRTICNRLRQLYQNGVEKYKSKRLKDIFPFKEETDETKTLDDYMPRGDEKKPDENETNLPIRYPKIQEDPSDFYVQFSQPCQSIMKKRPYESSENSNEGSSEENHANSIYKLIFSLFS